MSCRRVNLVRFDRHITILAKDKDIVFPQERREVYLVSFGIVK